MCLIFAFFILPPQSLLACGLAVTRFQAPSFLKAGPSLPTLWKKRVVVEPTSVTLYWNKLFECVYSFIFCYLLFFIFVLYLTLT